MFLRGKKKKAIPPHKISTIFYPGIICSQTQVVKYMGEREIKATTGEYVSCRGHRLDPINVIMNPTLGPEIKDVNIGANNQLRNFLNPITTLTSLLTRFANWQQGIQIRDPENPNELQGSLKNYSLNISEISFGQETDMVSHREKYQEWHDAHPNHDEFVVLYGESRGAATTLNALVKFRYARVKLVILEGCFYSFKELWERWYLRPVAPLVKEGLELFTQYRTDGPSPEKSVEDFPEGIPVVFITSQKDWIVPATSTEKLAEKLASYKKNDVYLLKLKNSSHPNYMFDDPHDRHCYESFIHAIYRKYFLPHHPALADQGEHLLTECLKTVPLSPKIAPF